MYKIYAALIIKDKIKFWEVPRQIKERVRKTLIDLDCEHLIIEERPAE